MAIISRQTGLLAAENWDKVYQTFREADFTAYDFETLRKSMIDYIRINYPEDFNDYTESSEFIALIDLIAFFGQSLAFRTDLNARENFIDTAERRDSILKLARLVGYNPKRNRPASGMLKIDSISTTETVFDSDGNNLTGVTVQWNDVTNENWQEQFNTIVNASLQTNQAVGKPSASKLINGIRHDEYGVNISTGILPINRFDSTVEGSRMTFEAVSATTYNQNYVYEADPDINRPFNIIYKNDNNGNSSNNTGFFIFFKQGELTSSDFTVENQITNNIIDIDRDGINNSDVWLYSLDSAGFTSELWQSVPSVTGYNIIYNNSRSKNLYQVNSRANDRISLVFGDGGFANIPLGNFRLYHRISNGLSYRITPEDIRGVSISIGYVSKYNRLETLTIRASLRYTVANANARESIDDIRQRAPQQYYTQNRMVTGEDYNILPYTSFNNVIKVKAINRTSSGISRYLDELDSSGKYSSTNIFGDDGVLYKENYTGVINFTYTTYADIIRTLYETILPGIFNNKDLVHYYYSTVAPETPLATPIAADSLVNGQKYTITSVGTTNFNLYGSPSNTVGTTFTAVFAGTRTRTYSVTNTANAFVFTGNAFGNNVNVTGRVGDTLTFTVATPGHPFYIKTAISTGNANVVTTGTVTNAGIQTGTVTWNTTGVAPGTYYYVSGNNTTLKGNIVIESFGTGTASTELSWNLSSVGDSVCTGYFVYNAAPSAVGTAATTQNKYIQPGAMIRFVAPTGYYFNGTSSLLVGQPFRAEDSTELVVSVMRVAGDGTNNGLGSFANGTGPVSLSQKVPTGALVGDVVPLFRNSFGDAINDFIVTNVENLRSFALDYSSVRQGWQILTIADSVNLPWMIKFEYNISTGAYAVSTKGTRYIFHSPATTNFYAEDSQSIYDIETNRYIQDNIKILRNNSNPDITGAPLGRDYTWAVYRSIIQPDGYRETKSVYLTYTDSNNDGVPDNSMLFENIVQPTVSVTTKYVFFRTRPSYDQFTDLVLVDNKTVISNFFDIQSINNQIANFEVGQLFFVVSTQEFRQVTLVNNVKTLSAALSGYIMRIGRQNLYYQYRHNSPFTNRIDPSISNIIDIYMLTSSYDTAYRRWLTDNTNSVVKPTAPTNTELAMEFSELEQVKTISDTMVFHTAVYKPLFGAKAQESLRAIFKVVKNPTLSVSDADVKAKVISAVNDYFDIENWEFGETFYFSELSAYLHQQLAPDIASVVLVPKDSRQSFGNMYQINAEPNEIIVSAATVDDVEVISAVTAAQLNQALATT